MRDKTLKAIAARLAANKADRTRVRRVVASGNPVLAEDDLTRRVAYEARAARPLGKPEAVQGINDFQPASFLVEGAEVRRSIARVLVQTPHESRSGSGFLISPDLFITNQHVIQNRDDAGAASVVFDDELDQTGRALSKTSFRLDPDRLALFSDEEDLDFAVIALGERIEGNADVAGLGYSPLSFTPDRHRKGINVNIVQHPNGMPKTIAIRNNLVTERDDTHLYYETDTDFGSSGAAVYNDSWDVVALHHYGNVELPSATGPKQMVNEGIRISAIYTDLQERAKALDAVSQELITRALSLWVNTDSGSKKLERRPAAVVPRESQVVAASLPSEEPSMNVPFGTSTTLVIPLEVTVRVGAATADTAPPLGASVIAPAAPPTKRLSRTPEKVALDTDYANRNGFDGEFVPGLKLDLKAIVKPSKKLIAPLRPSEAEAASGHLRYQNFSVILHKNRRLALLTATNVDGASYIAIDRDTGEPAAFQPEGETWYRDTRIDEAFTVTQDFYSGWSHLFDRGHLTRRNDPTWGDNAVRANTDTFHFSNCATQHWKFNQSVQFWQGIERYVLEQGLFTTGRNKPLIVLQGPVFDDATDQWADDVQVPSAFWKIVVWKGKGGHKAVALVADQTALLSLERKGGTKPPPNDTPVQVAQFRISIPALEQKTGLDLSKIRAFDTSDGDLPRVGERLELVTKWSDIRLD